MKVRFRYISLAFVLAIWLAAEYGNIVNPGVFARLEKHWDIDGGKLRLNQGEAFFAMLFGKPTYLVAPVLTAIFLKDVRRNQKESGPFVISAILCLVALFRLIVLRVWQAGNVA